MTNDPAVSIVIPTRNRVASLERILRSVLRLKDIATAEVLVVDNGSTDDTAARVREWAARSNGLIRYLHDPRPGVSHARNTGIASARSPIVALLDDDEEVPDDWLLTLCSSLADPDVAFVGGPYVPVWSKDPPGWIQGRQLGGPLSMIDGGDTPRRITPSRWLCLGGGNMAVRRDILVRLSGFDAAYPRSQDRELVVRLLLNGYTGLYHPGLVVYHHLDGSRLTKDYYRRWYETEGRMRAGYAFEELFLSGAELGPLPETSPRLAGVAPAIYRQLGRALLSCAAALATFRSQDAFRHELRFRYLLAYIRRRQALHVSAAESRWSCLIRDGMGLLKRKVTAGPT